MITITCPKCKTESTDKDFDEGEESCSYWIDDKGFAQIECWECNHEWEEKWGKKL